MQVILSYRAHGMHGGRRQTLQEQRATSIELDAASLDAASLDAAAMSAIVESLTALVQTLRERFPVEDEPGASGTGLQEVSFEVHLTEGGRTIRVLDEDELFERAAELEPAHGAVLDFVAATGAGPRGKRLWHDEETPAGTAAMRALALRDVRYVDAYVDFLRSNDMDHEVHQGEHIAAIVEAHGWCEATFRLAVARAVSCAGQQGEEQMSELVEAGLAEYIARHEDDERMFAIASEELATFPYLLRLREWRRPDVWRQLAPWTDILAEALPASWISRLRAEVEAA